MGEIVNLREFRKRQSRDKKQAKSTEKRALTGQSRADRLRIAVEKEKAESQIKSNLIKKTERDEDETA